MKNYNWNDISINKYYKLKDVFEETGITEMEKNVKAASIIMDIEEETIWDMPIQTAFNIMNDLAFLDDFKLIKISKNTKSLNIAGSEFDLVTDVSSLSLAQYTDYQTFVTMPFRQAIDKILSVFVLPKGKKYNDGYDIINLQDFLRNNLSFVMAQSLINFLLTKYFNSILHSLKYLVKEMKREKDPVKKAIIGAKIEEMKEKVQNFLCSIGCVSSKE